MPSPTKPTVTSQPQQKPESKSKVPKEYRFSFGMYKADSEELEAVECGTVEKLSKLAERPESVGSDPRLTREFSGATWYELSSVFKNDVVECLKDAGIKARKVAN
ncbi:hypothetical protein PM082_005591 [Marasmius tenuissimus]|nr:hypothetical protein PM082_005591 [Marasmius tenuissimus]